MPTPALSELLVRAGDAGPKYLEIIARSKFFRVAEFGTRAAVEAARSRRGKLTPRVTSAARHRRQSGPRSNLIGKSSPSPARWARRQSTLMMANSRATLKQSASRQLRLTICPRHLRRHSLRCRWIRWNPRPELMMTMGPNYDSLVWLGRQGSNLRMAESKSAALPLGDAPRRADLNGSAAASQRPLYRDQNRP